MKRKTQSSSTGHRKRRQTLRGASSRDLVCDLCWEQLFSTQSYRDLCYGDHEWLLTDYSTTVSEIQRSAEAGCSWCSFLCDVARFRRRCLSHTVKVIVSQHEFFPNQFGLPSVSNPLLKIFVSVDGTRLLVAPVLDEPEEVAILAEKRQNTLTENIDLFSLIKKYIDHCSCERSQQKVTQEQLPARLVDLWPAASCQSAALVSADTSHTPYTTLSYCWGLRQKSETTSVNALTRMQGLQENELPQTMQDAFLIARQLGYRYIWVDALCIIQDSHEDKLRELGRMTNIYENADLTIFAASAYHADEGILRHYPTLPNAARVPFWNADGGATSVMFQAVAELKQKQDEPGLRRAWTYQELMLSKRVLTYTSSGVEYRCTAGTRNIDEMGHRTLWDDYASDKFLSVSLSSHTCFNMEMWLRLLMVYTLGNITYDEDRLLALSGIAEKFQHVSQAPYVAGIFINEFLPQQLVWTPNWEGDQFVQDFGTYIAPSWSWASHKTPVSYRDRVTRFETFKYCDHEVALKYPDLQFGPVSSAQLHVKGQLRKVTEYSSTVNKQYDSHNNLYFDDGKNCSASVDRRISLYRRIEWFCLPVLWMEMLDEVLISGLVISPTKDSGTFYRVGQFSYASAESFDDLDEQDIILV